MRLRFLKATGLYEPLEWLAYWLDRQLARWPWLYRKLGE